VETGPAIVVVANNSIGDGALRRTAWVCNDGAGTDEAGDKDTSSAAWTAVRDAVHFIHTRAAVTGILNCTACCNTAHSIASQVHAVP